ncbi:MULTISPECIES: response regulator transcription factor [unclassified Pseudomonas]|jgi:DNA-binding NarL/FixJ family response regulator|uniref:response regulator transcription factor n=1 Tax=unclassified Pseudomonas TaxID=196821 RepID=UPI001D8BECE7|nr:MULTISPECIES: response regulator transcription factor [unclassified Pseudomonas]MDQ7985037.1 response regulator transcription factor [Pseudomonas sp. G34]CAH0294951.1 Adenylate cyclase 2 [Pseudomonas sp. Bi70]
MDRINTLRIMIVDDEPHIVEELAEFLEQLGYEVTSCNNTHDALQAFQADERIAIVLSDMHMPGLTGVQLVAELARLGRPGRLYETAIFTGSTDKQDVILALRAGVSDYYQKPVNLQELEAGVKRLQERVEQKLKEQQIRQQIQDLAASLHEMHSELIPTIAIKNVAQMSATADTVPEPFDKLSRRQLAVAQLIAKGMTNYQISCELGITENTVKLYVSQILRLTRVHNRTQLALSYPSHG